MIMISMSKHLWKKWVVPLSFDPTQVSARQAIETQLEVSNISWIAPLVS